jgi:ribonuclease-3
MKEKTLPRDPAELEKLTGHVFASRELLTEALTHSSYSNEHGGLRAARCNERLEFLGDSVLSLIVSDYLFQRFPGSPEGELTRMRSELVNEKACAEYASFISLGDFLLLGRGEEKGGGRRRRSVTADAYEALIAAVWIDAGEGTGGKEAVRAFLMPRVAERLADLRREWCGADYKTLLQQVVQGDSKGSMLEYVLAAESGPDHDKTFTVDAVVDSNVFGTGTGRTKREAEQEAARQALVKCGVIAENADET